MPKPTRLSTRRDFLRSACAAAAAAPYFVPASAFGAAAPSNRITLGCIGVGNQGAGIMKKFLGHDNCQVVAVCDVNRASFGYRDADQFLGREPAKKTVEEFYANKTGAGSYAGCDIYEDFRELLARDDLDAVTVVTPDHWHAYITIAAAAAGKDIYCEKPLSLTIAHGQAMVAAVRQHGRILQTGSHERSNPIVRRACELVRNGYIGEVRHVVAHVGRNNKVGPGPGWQPAPVPDGFDYEMWLGPAPEAPYHDDRCLYRFRFNYDYSGGQVTNYGAHSLDIAQWGLGADDRGPESVEPVYAEYLPAGSLFNTATYTHFRCRYASGAELDCFTAEPSVRCAFEGTEGTVRVDASGKNFVTTPASLRDVELKADDLRLGDSQDHQRDFLDAVKTRRDPSARVEVGHRSATVCHLGNIALKVDRNLAWNPEREMFEGAGSDEANALLSRETRGPWLI
jgi:predicted dehydrogenase